MQSISKVQISIPLAKEFNHVRGHQDERIPDQLLYRSSQINIRCNVLEKMLVREEWKQNFSTRGALPHELIICKVAGRKITGDIGKAVRDDSIRKTIREFLDQKGRMKVTTFD